MCVSSIDAIEYVLPVDETVGERWRAGWKARIPPHCKRRDMTPVLKHDSSEIFIVVGRRRSVNNNGTLKADRILQTEMGVVP